MNRRGFTLIELLVVISIIGLISSVALANLQDVKEKAKEAAGKQFQATVNHALGADLIAGWEFNGVVATPATPESIVTDLQGPNVDESNPAVENVYYEDDGASGVAGVFDGQTSYVAGLNFPDVGADSDITVTAWVNPTSVVNENTIFFQGNNNGTCSSFQVGIKGGKGFVNGTTETTSYAIVNNAWQNLTYVYHKNSGSGASVDTYINGVKISTTPGIQTSSCATGQWSLGAKLSYNSSNVITNTSNQFSGKIDNVFIYGAALTASEIGKIYALGPHEKIQLAKLYTR